MRIAESYSVIVIPKDKARVRRWIVSRQRILSVIGLSGGLVLSVAALCGGFIHYRQSFLATADLRDRANQYSKERTQVYAHLNELESVIEENEQLAGRLEGVVGIRPASGVRVGVGGVEENQPIGTLQLASLDPFDNAVEGMRQTQPRKMVEDVFNESELREFNLKSIELTEEAKHVSTRLNDVYNFHSDAEYFWTAIPTVAPAKGWVTSDFGVRRSPLSGRRQLHEGLDIACPPGSPVRATGDGVVTFSGWQGGLGKKVVIDHGYGLTTVYGHNSDLVVKNGDRVQRNQVIARVGSTGRSTGPHVHYEVLIDGVPVDPRRFIIEQL